MGKIVIPGGSVSAASDDCTAARAQILTGYTAITRDSSDEPITGTMPNNGTQSALLNCGQSKVIPAGYTGGGTVTANSLASQTPSNAGAGHLLSGYRAWMNGADTWGSMPSMGGQTVRPGLYQTVVSCAGKYMTGNIVFQGLGEQPYRMYGLTYNTERDYTVTVPAAGEMVCFENCNVAVYPNSATNVSNNSFTSWIKKGSTINLGTYTLRYDGSNLYFSGLDAWGMTVKDAHCQVSIGYATVVQSMNF